MKDRWTKRRLLKLRRSYGVSQEGLARLVKCSTSSVRNWEQDVSEPDRRHAETLAQLERTAAAAKGGAKGGAG